MRNLHITFLLVLAPVASWSQGGGQNNYTPTTPAGSYLTDGIPVIQQILYPPPPSITLPPLWGRFHCENGQWVYTTYQIQITPPFHVNTVPHDESTGKECDPSDNGQGGPLTNSDSMNVFSPTTGPYPSPHSNPAQAVISPSPKAEVPAPGPKVSNYSALVRALPFPPDYSPSLLTALPPCNPSTATQIFQVSHSSASVTHFNSCNLQVIATIPVQSRPLQVAITPDDRLAIVTSFDNAITLIDTSTNAVVSVINPGISASGIAISPDGTRAYVTNFTAGNLGSGVAVVDIQHGQVLSMIHTDAYPQSVFLSPDGSVAYVTFPFGNRVQLIDTLTGTISGSLQIGATYGVAFNSTGTQAFITSQQTNDVKMVSTKDNSILASFPLSVPPDEVRITPDDQWLFVNSYLGNATIIINPATGEIEVSQSSGPPHGLAIVQ
jgi:DNA-binding beta-propeller fold protein YncE